MSGFEKTNSQLYFSKNDPQDIRLGDLVKDFDIHANSNQHNEFNILGYADDEGISINGGRLGAELGPERIRHFLYRMTPSFEAKKSVTIIDHGNITKNSVPQLKERHEIARRKITNLCLNKQKFISLGGGHDYGYSDACGFLDSQTEPAIVINFDAHLDVRPDGIHSGAPFRRMLTEFKNKVYFYEIGIQSQCNSKDHSTWAIGQGAKIISNESVNNQGLLKILQEILNGVVNKDITEISITNETIDKKNIKKNLFISLDIDFFASQIAPGCSQSWPSGIELQNFMEGFDWLLKNFNVYGLGIYETSPPLDVADNTSKLAALVAHKYIYGTKN